MISLNLRLSVIMASGNAPLRTVSKPTFLPVCAYPQIFNGSSYRGEQVYRFKSQRHLSSLYCRHVEDVTNKVFEVACILSELASPLLLLLRDPLRHLLIDRQSQR
jgi:hypothetical protein